ncbi:MAG: hypothetical protein ABIZ81_02125 [Opitutaceae bacterium]
MDHPTRSRSRAALLLTASVAALLVARAMPDAGTGFTLQLVLLIGGAIGTTLSAVWLLVCWSEVKRYTRLKAGEGVIARWTVDPVRWDWFRRQSKEWDKREGVRPNLVNLDQTPGTSGIEIVVTGDCILIGENFHALDKNVAIRGQPEWMEFHQTIWKQYGPHLHVNLRIPLAPGGQHQADQIMQVYRQAHTAATARPRTKIYVLLGILVGLPVLTGLIALVMHLLKRGP